MRRALLLGVGALFLLAQGAWAFSTLWGGTGLIEVPTADTLGMAGVSAGAAEYIEADLEILRADIGISPEIEVGATKIKDQTAFNAKVVILRGLPPLVSQRLPAGYPAPETELERKVEEMAAKKLEALINKLLRPTVAVGVRNVNEADLRAGPHGMQIYAVASARVPLLKLGVHYGLLRDRTKLGTIMGADLKLIKGFHVMAEFERDHFNAGVRFALPGPGLTALVALLDVDGRKDLLVSAGWKFSF